MLEFACFFVILIAFKMWRDVWTALGQHYAPSLLMTGLVVGALFGAGLPIFAAGAAVVALGLAWITHGRRTDCDRHSITETWRNAVQ